MSLRRPATLALLATSLWVVVCVGTPCFPAIARSPLAAMPAALPLWILGAMTVAAVGIWAVAANRRLGGNAPWMWILALVPGVHLVAPWWILRDLWVRSDPQGKPVGGDFDKPVVSWIVPIWGVTWVADQLVLAASPWSTWAWIVERNALTPILACLTVVAILGVTERVEGRGR